MHVIYSLVWLVWEVADMFLCSKHFETSGQSVYPGAMISWRQIICWKAPDLVPISLPKGQKPLNFIIPSKFIVYLQSKYKSSFQRKRLWKREEKFANFFQLLPISFYRKTPSAQDSSQICQICRQILFLKSYSSKKALVALLGPHSNIRSLQ